MNAPCYQHDSYHSECSSCREMNGVPRYVVRKSTDKRYSKAYPWSVYDIEDGRIVAMGSRDRADSWAKQLNEVGYVQAE